MRTPFAHRALLLLPPGGDARAPGAAITLESCGSWEHDPPCPLAAHYTSAQRDDSQGDGDRLVVRVIFSCEPANEAEVRQRIEHALRPGALTGPDGATTRWVFSGSTAEVPTPRDVEHARRLVT
ncbi:hypothetical protein ACIP9X_09860 [Arthrobacter sp. NPDC093125]|uniref:hypothetical protein n=1 Tax=Arthrobacter sp. NPDC093125 TaxID=3363944 RepID=UPI00382507DD